MTKILVINGAYRDGGITDRTVEAMVEAIEAQGATSDVVLLRDHPIGFCLNCRECTQQPGEAPGRCVQADGMADLVARIEGADGFVLASPTNFSSVTALFKRFMERLIVYAYWPWGTNAPRFRKARVKRKQAVLVSSCAAPGLLGRLSYSSRKQLKMTAKVIGADTVATVFTGLISGEPHPALPERVHSQAVAAARRLVSACRSS